MADLLMVELSLPFDELLPNKRVEIEENNRILKHRINKRLVKLHAVEKVLLKSLMVIMNLNS